MVDLRFLAVFEILGKIYLVKQCFDADEQSIKQYSLITCQKSPREGYTDVYILLGTAFC